MEQLLLVSITQEIDKDGGVLDNSMASEKRDNDEKTKSNEINSKRTKQGTYQNRRYNNYKL